MSAILEQMDNESANYVPDIILHSLYKYLAYKNIFSLQFSNVVDYFGIVLPLVQNVRPKIYHAWAMFLFPAFAVCHPETVKILLKSSAPKTKYHRGGGYRMAMPWLGTRKYIISCEHTYAYLHSFQ